MPHSMIRSFLFIAFILILPNSLLGKEIKLSFDWPIEQDIYFTETVKHKSTTVLLEYKLRLTSDKGRYKVHIPELKIIVDGFQFHPISLNSLKDRSPKGRQKFASQMMRSVNKLRQYQRIMAFFFLNQKRADFYINKKGEFLDFTVDIKAVMPQLKEKDIKKLSPKEQKQMTAIFDQISHVMRLKVKTFWFDISERWNDITLEKDKNVITSIPDPLGKINGGHEKVTIKLIEKAENKLKFSGSANILIRTSKSKLSSHTLGDTMRKLMQAQLGKKDNLTYDQKANFEIETFQNNALPAFLKLHKRQSITSDYSAGPKVTDMTWEIKARLQ